MIIKLDKKDNVDIFPQKAGGRQFTLSEGGLESNLDICNTMRSYYEKNTIHPFSGRASLPIKDFSGL